MDTNPSNPVATSSYISGRKKYARPQAMLWADGPGTIVSGVRIPSDANGNPAVEKESFIITSDHNRGEISISQQRIETRQRMINGTMRSYHIADKINLSVSWSNLPSRSHSTLITYDSNGNPIKGQSILDQTLQYYTDNGLALPVSYNPNTQTYVPPTETTSIEYTADGGAGGVDILDWYENHSGPFYVYLAYDKYNNNSFKVANEITSESFNYLSIYNDIRLMYFSSFEYSIQKRGATNHDMWNISVSLEEV